MTDKSEPQPSEDVSPLSWAPWLTPKRAFLFVVAWLALFALFSAAMSNPFRSEPHAGATPDYASVMFLHGLLIGMVGLISLATVQVMRLRSMHTRAWIVGGVVAATLLASIGGIWDRSIPGSEIPMWTQILGFFALDEILIVLIIGILAERKRAMEIGRLPFMAGLVGAVGMLGAAVMGHLAGWILEFGEGTPQAIASFRAFAGFDGQDSFTRALVGSHSHEMAVSAMGMAVIVLSVQFGYSRLTGTPRGIARVGMGMVAGGTALVSAFYLVTGFSTWAPPAAIATIGSAPNLIPIDDVISGVLVMGGGVVAAAAFLPSLLAIPVRFAAAWSYVLATATVAVAGYSIELHTTFFGAGDQKAAGAAGDAIFTWLHQDIGLFLLPSMLVVMLAAERFVTLRAAADRIGRVAIAGTTLLFAGGMFWVFVNPDLHGPGYFISTAGVVLTGGAVLATIWYSGLAALFRPRASAAPKGIAPVAH